MRKLISRFLFICLFMATSCGPSVPSESQARQIAEGPSGQLTQLGAKMIDFRKLNGVSQEVLGQKIYEYDFLAAFELPAGLAWVKQTALGGGGFVKDPGPGWEWGVQSIPRGSIAVEKGKISFRLTEKGWVSDDHPDDLRSGYCTGATSPQACYASTGFNTVN